MAQPPFDLAQAHRWFGIECNNAAWTLLEQASRTADETERLLHAAHAAMLHWGEIGTAINRLRGLSLLATAYTAAGREEEAIRWAGAALALAEQLGGAPSTVDQHPNEHAAPFDLACAHGAAARAFRLAEYAEEADGHEAAARDALAACDEEERQVIAKLYGVRA